MADDPAQITKSLRAMAANRGFRLATSRVRTPGRKDHGKFGLEHAASGKPCLGFGKNELTATADEIEAFLRGQTASTWSRSVDEGGPPPASSSRTKATPRARARPKRSAPAPARPGKRRPAATRVSPARTDPKPKPPPEERPAAPPPIRLRNAAANDLKAIRALLLSIEGAAPPRDLKRFIGAQARAGMPCLVADDGQVIGFVAASLVALAHRTAPLGRIGTLVVAATRRREGIATMLADKAEAQLRRKGCTAIEAAVEIDYSGAGLFFKQRGYDRSTYRFVRPLD